MGTMNRMCRAIIVVTVLGFAGAAVLAEEGSPATGSGTIYSGRGAIYVVDMERIISQSIAGKAARNTMQEEVKKAEKKLQLLKGEIDKLKSDTAKQVNVLSDAALEERKEAIAKRERDMQRAMDDNREDLAKKNDAAMGAVIQRIDSVIHELSASGTYPLIVEKDPRFVVYANDRFDITSVVITALDEKGVG